MDLVYIVLELVNISDTRILFCIASDFTGISKEVWEVRREVFIALLGVRSPNSYGRTEENGKTSGLPVIWPTSPPRTSQIPVKHYRCGHPAG
jgi:hypothetical protein